MTESDEPLSSFEMNTYWSDKLQRYVVRVTFSNENLIFEMADEAAVYAYVDAILCAATASEYDAAIFRQMKEMFELDDANAAAMVAEFRQHRPPLLDPFAKAAVHGQGIKRGVHSTGFFDLEPGVSGITGLPFIHLFIRGKRVAQWECEVARTHALNVMSIAQAAKWDTAYRDYIAEVVGVGNQKASAAVHFLSRYRPEQEMRPGDVDPTQLRSSSS